MKTGENGGKAEAGNRRPRFLFRTAVLLILLWILLFLVWVRACVPGTEKGEEPHRTAGQEEPDLPQIIWLTALPRNHGQEPAGTAGADTTPEADPPGPEETPDPAGSEALPAAPAAQKSGTQSGALKKGMLGVLTYKKKSVGIWPDIREETLLKGPGWVAESALPGEGMCVIFGHRNRNHLLLIKKIREGDTLTFTYADGRTLTYRVRTVQIFETTAAWRLPTESGDVLVIATCYPFQYTGSAPGKFQVIADRIG